MTCKNCGGSNISVQYVQTGSKTKSKATTRKKKRGCLYWICFFWLIDFLTWCFTFWSPSRRRSKTKGSSKTTIQNEKRAVCNECGYSWRIK